MQELLSVLAEEWAVRALIASSLVGILCGTIGSFMVLRNMSLIGDAISHAILPGIFFAFVLVGYGTTGFFIGSLLAALLSVVAMTWIQDNVKTKNDAALGIIFTFMFSIGVIGISYLNNQQGVHLDLKDFLFGTVLGVSTEDIIITIMVTIFSLSSIVIFYRYLFITTFQPIIAATMGISVRAIHYFLMLLLSFAIVASLRTVGIILVVAMLITPSATALLLSDKLKNVIVISGIIGFLSAALGLILAIIFDTTPGPAMCVVVTAFYFLVVFLSPKNGLVIKRIRKRRLNAQIEREDIMKYLSKHKTITSTQLESVSKAIGLKITRLRGHLKALVKGGKLSAEENEFSLTKEGNDIALNLVRAHRLWETFLVDKVGLKSHEIHEDAEKYEHFLDSDLLDQLDAKLGYPNFDPHGSPIPSKSPRAERPLVQILEKQTATISSQQLSNEIESQLWELGLTAQSTIYIEMIGTKEMTVKHGDRLLSISKDLASQINVENTREVISKN